MKIYGTWDAFLVEQLKEQEDVSGYLDAVIEEYQIHGNLTTVQLALQYVVEAQGCTAIGNLDHPLNQDCDTIQSY